LISHSKNPRNRGALADPSHRALAENPLCGDRFEIHLKVVADRIVDIGFVGDGCAISMASASLMTLKIKGWPHAEVSALSARFARLITGGTAGSGDSDDAIDLGELVAFAGVARFPARTTCARLPWDALAAALGR
jgi:nitrogen fixation NifU-like protein